MARPRAHLAVALGLAAIQRWRGGGVSAALAPLVSGFLIDADHLLDHRLYHRSPERGGRRIVLPLHGWEYLPLVAWLESRLLGDRTRRGLALGYLAHLALDQVTNETTTPLGYSLAYRLATGFRAEVFRGQAGEHAWRQTPLWQLWKWL